MLEERPIVKKSLFGAGAFAFVFVAAMGGTAFMISGGFGGGERAPADPPAYQIAANDAWSNDAPSTAAQTRPHVAVTPASLQVAPPAPAPVEQLQSDTSAIQDNSTPPNGALSGAAPDAQPEPPVSSNQTDNAPAKSAGT